MNKKIFLILEKLSCEYPDAKCHLKYNNAFELMISTVLAAQCTDERVNLVMVPLYKSIYKNCKDILNNGIENFRKDIKSINFFNNKTSAIFGLCKTIQENYGGKIPSTMEDLTGLNGIGRKSASVILGNCFGKKDVIIVDTHLKRVSLRLKLTENSIPEKIENDLKEIIPNEEQFIFSMRIGEHGRQVCKAKSQKCLECILNELCPSNDLLN